MNRYGFAICLTFVCFTATQAGTVRFSGEVGSFYAVPGETRAINVVFDLDSEDSFMNGGIELSVTNSNPSFIRFTGADILNSPFRWSASLASRTEDAVSLRAYSVISPAMPQGGQNVLFATINYEFIEYFGVAKLEFGVELEALVDGRSYGTDVTSNYTFVGSSIRGLAIPEPTSFVLGVVGCVVVLLRQRTNRRVQN